MTRMLQAAAKITLALILASPAFPQQRVDELGQAFNRMYNFDFPGAQSILEKRIAATPDDSLPYAVRASAYLFSELDRLSILESEFFSDDSHIIDKKKVKPDPVIRTQLFQAIADAQSRAQSVLAKDPNNQDALFSMCITNGVL